MKEFKLDSRLDSDLKLLGEFDLCQVRLMPSEYNPWLVLIPKRPEISEWHDLNDEEQAQLQNELNLASRAMVELFQPTPLNLGALGNNVRQFHLQIIERYEVDPSWPGPVWGKPRGEDQEKMLEIESKLKNTLFPK
ncbi:MAG: HIT family protein [Bdellovibrionales bacterium]|nr:HIT family protein [Bdellovibrionales bacterium]